MVNMSLKVTDTQHETFSCVLPFGAGGEGGGGGEGVVYPECSVLQWKDHGLAFRL